MELPYKIVFDAFHLYHLPQFDPVIDLLRKDERFDVYLTTSSENESREVAVTQKIFQEKNLPVLSASNEDERARVIREFNPDIYVCGWSRYPIENYVPDDTLVAMIYHGIGVKPSYWRDNNARIDLRLVEGEYRQQQLIEKNVDTGMALTGFAKLDPVFNKSVIPRHEFLDAMGLDPEKPTILYAPTYYPSSLERFSMRFGKDTQGYNILIKLHMWVHFKRQFIRKLYRQHTYAQKLARRFEHIKVVPPEWYNIIPMYQAADILLTEASSTIIEMLALKKPVALCEFYKLRLSHSLFRYRLYSKRLDETMSKEVAEHCYPVSRPRLVRETIDQALTNFNPDDPDLDNYIHFMVYHRDGRASERIRDALLERVKHGR